MQTIQLQIQAKLNTISMPLKPPPIKLIHQKIQSNLNPPIHPQWYPLNMPNSHFGIYQNKENTQKYFLLSTSVSFQLGSCVTTNEFSRPKKTVVTKHDATIIDGYSATMNRLWRIPFHDQTQVNQKYKLTENNTLPNKNKNSGVNM